MLMMRVVDCILSFTMTTILDILHSLIYVQIVSSSVFNSNFAVFSSLLPTLIFAGPSESSFVLLKSFLICQIQGRPVHALGDDFKKNVHQKFWWMKKV